MCEELEELRRVHIDEMYSFFGKEWKKKLVLLQLARIVRGEKNG